MLLHAGGLEISRFLPDKSPAEFDLVFDVKADGWFHLLHGLGDVPIGTALVFSSIAGRFGNGGQTDYSAANDLLCKSVSSFRSTRPETRGVAIDWTAWAGIGMASRGSIPKMMALAGIDMLPPEIGIPAVRREITAGGTGGEVVVAGALGAMLDAPGSPPEPSAVAGAGPMVGQVAMRRRDGVVVVTDLDPAAQPFLRRPPHRGHARAARRDGHGGVRRGRPPARPGVGGHGHRGRRVPRPVQVVSRRAPPGGGARRAVPDGDHLVANCRLDGRRTLPGQPEQVTTHFTGRVVLGPTAGDLGTVTPPRAPDGPVVAPDAIYKRVLPRPRLPGAGRRVAGRRRDRRRIRHRAAGEPRPGGRAARRRPSAGRAVLPDRRRGRTGHRGHAGPAAAGAPPRGGAGGRPRPPPAGRS